VSRICSCHSSAASPLANSKDKRWCVMTCMLPYGQIIQQLRHGLCWSDRNAPIIIQIALNKCQHMRKKKRTLHHLRTNNLLRDCLAKTITLHSNDILLFSYRVTETYYFMTNLKEENSFTIKTYQIFTGTGRSINPYVTRGDNKSFENYASQLK
jgi:hypothetical protein